MERDDELRAMKLCHRTLMQLNPEARRRAVRYLVDRHVTSTEPPPFPNPAKVENPILDAVRRAQEGEVSPATALEMARAHVTGEKSLAQVMGEGILSERSGS